RDAAAAEGDVRPHQDARQQSLPGQAGRLHGAELRAHHGDRRNRGEAQGTDSGQRQRVEGRRADAAAAGITGGWMMKATTRSRIVASLAAAMALLIATFAGAARAQTNAIESINVSPAAGGNIVVRVTLRETPAGSPAGFTVNNPPRIAFDFPNTSSTLTRGSQDVSEGDLRSINVVQAG